MFDRCYRMVSRHKNCSSVHMIHHSKDFHHSSCRLSRSHTKLPRSHKHRHRSNLCNRSNTLRQSCNQEAEEEGVWAAAAVGSEKATL
jgi:hypothetical protein